MFLRNLELVDVRGFQKASIAFTNEHDEARPWTLMLGPNGVGKSTLLRAIALLTTGSDAMTDLLGRPEEWVRNGASKAVLKAKLQTPVSDPFEVEIEIRRTDTISKVLDRNLEPLSWLDGILADRDWLPTVGYGVSRRASAETLRTRSRTRLIQPRARAVATLFYPFEELVSLESWAMDLDYRRGEKALGLIRDALHDILMPGVEFVDIAREQRELVFRTDDGDMPLSQLSDGFQSVVAWVGDLLFHLTDTFALEDTPLSAAGLLLLDEIELHLHPKWQRRLVEYLGQLLPNFQFVSTTHSPLTAQQVGRGELFTLERGSKGPTVIPFAGEPRKLFLHQLLDEPIFDIPMSSKFVEDRRARLRELTDKHAPTDAEKEEIEALQAELDSVPQWNRIPQPERHAALLTRLERRLAELPDEDPPRSKKARRKKSLRGRG